MGWLDSFTNINPFKNPLSGFPVMPQGTGDPMAALSHTGIYGSGAGGPYSAGYLNPTTNPYGLPWGLVGTGGNPYPGVSSLIQLLQNPGQTDPRALAQNVQATQAGTQQQQQNATGALAARGLGGGGFSDVVNAAIGQGGQNRVAGLYAQNAQAQSDKQRQDLVNLLGGLVQGGKLDYRQVLAGINASQGQQNASNNQAIAGGVAGLLGLAAAFA